MKIVFLGTGGGMPTPSRSSPAVVVKRKGRIILFDCGEGTQQQMVAARIGFRRPTLIFISHMHGDHILGLPGLLQTMTLLRRERTLKIYGPLGIVRFINAFSDVLGYPSFPLEVNEILESSVVFSSSEFRVEAVRAEHEGECWSFAIDENPVPGRFHPEKAKALGVSEGPLWKKLQYGGDVLLNNGRLIKSIDVVDPPRRGRKIVYSGDTVPTEAILKIAEGADVLIHEATFDDTLSERAAENSHSTARQAAEVAAAAKVRRLLLTHISSRYHDPDALLQQAQEIFQDTLIAEDFMEVDVPL